MVHDSLPEPLQQEQYKPVVDLVDKTYLWDMTRLSVAIV